MQLGNEAVSECKNGLIVQYTECLQLTLWFGQLAHCLLQIALRPRQIRRPMDVQMSSAGDQQLKLQLRALDESQAESSRLKKLVELAALDPGEFCFNPTTCV